VEWNGIAGAHGRRGTTTLCAYVVHLYVVSSPTWYQSREKERERKTGPRGRTARGDLAVEQMARALWKGERGETSLYLNELSYVSFLHDGTVPRCARCERG
jgi:hypothetical protein